MTTTNHPVAVDPGDLSEALQAAEAWAGLLRCRLRYARTEFGGVPIAAADMARYESAADRIDHAVHALRLQSTYNERIDYQRIG